MACFRLSDDEWQSVKDAEHPLVNKRLEHKAKIRSTMVLGKSKNRKTRGKFLPGVRKRPASVIKRHTFNKERVARETV